MWFFLLWFIGIMTAFVHLYLLGFSVPCEQIASILLLHQFVVTFSLVGIIGFIENNIIGDRAAQAIGWPGGPYQRKYGFSQLGLGIIGIMSIYFKGNFWVGVLVSMYIYGLSGFWTHIAEMVKYKKWDVIHMLNLVMNILYQSFLTILSIMAGDVWITR